MEIFLSSSLSQPLKRATEDNLRSTRDTALALIERMERIDELVPELIAEIGKFSPESWRMIVASMIRMKVNLEDTDDGKVLKEMMDRCGF